MLRAILNKSWGQRPTKQQLYGHQSLITKTINIRRTRHAELCWRSRHELIRDVLLLTPSQRRAKAGWPAGTFIQQLCADTGCSSEDLPDVIDDKKGWWESVRDIRTNGTKWWWWWYIIGTVSNEKNRSRPTTKTLVLNKYTMNEIKRASQEIIDLEEVIRIATVCDGKLTKIPKRDFYFRTCEDGAGWHLIPYIISPRSEFFLSGI